MLQAQALRHKAVVLTKSFTPKPDQSCDQLETLRNHSMYIYAFYRWNVSEDNVISTFSSLTLETCARILTKWQEMTMCSYHLRWMKTLSHVWFRWGRMDVLWKSCLNGRIIFSCADALVHTPVHPTPRTPWYTFPHPRTPWHTKDV